MTLASEIIRLQKPDFEAYIRAGETLDDIDEYGFTPLIETIITHQIELTQELINYKVNINKSDVTGRTALHWAVDNNDIEASKLLLASGADPNAYTRSGLPVLVYPILRGQTSIKHLLYQYGAKLDFAMDFIAAKLLGHRFELKGDVDIVTAKGEFIELDYEGFILEFTIAVIKDSLQRFTSSYSTKQLRPHFHFFYPIMDALSMAEELLQFQHKQNFNKKDQERIRNLIEAPLLILPAASRGHAICFVKYEQWWAKIDRGENSLKEGSINIYQISRKSAFNFHFIQEFLYKKQSRDYFHQEINPELGLVPLLQIPISAQTVGNCSWANVQAAIPVAYVLQQLKINPNLNNEDALVIYDAWVEWDKDRALDECIQRFYSASDATRQASFASMLGGVLFQSCNAKDLGDIKRAAKILTILNLPSYYYILKSYLDIYCIKKLTRRGNNLLKLLDECNINPNIGVNPIATGLEE